MTFSINRNTTAVAATAFMLVMALPGATAGRHRCYREQDQRTVVSATAKDRDGLQHAFSAFQGLLGGKNNGNDKAQHDGFRNINWDAAGVPFDMPGDFFAATVTRGLTVSSSKGEFRVSNPADGSDDKFDSINHMASKDFVDFSPKRLFTPIGTTKTVITFSPAGKKGRATVNGFGAVFVDVDKRHSTWMTAYDKNGCIVYRDFVEPKNKGLSFLGVTFGKDKGDSIIAMVVLETGNLAIDSRRKLRGHEGRKDDIVVMDDFTYGEPQKIKH